MADADSAAARSAEGHFRAGRLDDALAAQTDAVKKAPADVAARLFLFELYCFAGDLERAGRSLNTLETLKSDLALACAAYRGCLAAEAERRACFTAGTAPKIDDAHRPALRNRLDALAALCGDDPAAAVPLLAPPPPRPATLHASADGDAGDRDGGATLAESAEDLRDADDLLAPVLEFYEGPHYRWAPWSALAKVEFKPVDKPRAVLFRGATLRFADGTDRYGFVPGLYPNSHEADDDDVRLGRTTSFVGFPPDPETGDLGPAFGVGGRLLRVAPAGGGDPEERPLAGIAELVFPPPAD